MIGVSYELHYLYVFGSNYIETVSTVLFIYFFLLPFTVSDFIVFSFNSKSNRKYVRSTKVICTGIYGS